MGGWLSRLFARLRPSKSLDVVLVGLEGSGKTTFLNLLSKEPMHHVTTPTLGLSIKQVKVRNLTLKMWDLGGGAQFRSEWHRYATGTHLILFMVDSSNQNCLTLCRRELHALLEHESLHGVHVLVLSNKIDLPMSMAVDDLVKELNLDYTDENPWRILPISALRNVGIEAVIDHMISVANNK
eukprot:gnl/Spiro4/17254_TR9180_c0_g1_i1.p1 gnl/Spiro4/17254_TR9180_c0_g1~~gnl/Spiro4/17254_TR9180_c0_g1_i1.p1  ORF type:complete len:182 (+),score=16.40 gnl/Spiro4/17254_TR9180_c0_g1_i1:161-706(+)